MHLMHFSKTQWSKTSKFQFFWTNIISILTPRVPAMASMAFRCHASCDTLWLGSDWFIQSNQSGEPVRGSLGALPSWGKDVKVPGISDFGWMKFRWTSKTNTIGTKRCSSLCFCFGAMCFCFSPTGMVECNSLWHGHFTTKLSTANLTPLICLSFWIATSLVTLQPKKTHTPGRNFKATNPLAHGFRFGRPSKNHWMRTSWYWH